MTLAGEADRDKHGRVQRRIAGGRLVFIDESGVTTSMTPTRGRSPRGERVYDYVPRNRGQVITLIGALSLSGLIAMATINAATSGDVFTAYVEQVLSPELKPGDVVIMDRLGAHRVARVVTDRHGAARRTWRSRRTCAEPDVGQIGRVVRTSRARQQGGVLRLRMSPVVRDRRPAVRRAASSDGEEARRFGRRDVPERG